MKVPYQVIEMLEKLGHGDLADRLEIEYEELTNNKTKVTLGDILDKDDV